ncbi:pentatricopeptide repeat-containing protein [Trifolium medium]|uniref:Pentatricopeptide repeat-containing protein n=1 Tax=Trifolium medium TaxID=97028 RepID=A0A392MR71_9FABA|nr:pentatricopeptide repeat-containing protein [Trifolium medium]
MKWDGYVPDIDDFLLDEEVEEQDPYEGHKTAMCSETLRNQAGWEELSNLKRKDCPVPNSGLRCVVSYHKLRISNLIAFNIFTIHADWFRATKIRSKLVCVEERIQACECDNIHEAIKWNWWVDPSHSLFSHKFTSREMEFKSHEIVVK